MELQTNIAIVYTIFQKYRAPLIKCLFLLKLNMHRARKQKMFEIVCLNFYLPKPLLSDMHVL